MGRLYEAVLHRLGVAGLIDVTRVVLDTAHVRAEKRGANTQGRAPWTEASRGSGCTSCRTPLRKWLRGKRIGVRIPATSGIPDNCLAFLGLAAAMCCYKRLSRLTTTWDTV